MSKPSTPLQPASARQISVIGLGYVGLPVAAAFGRQQKVIAFDINTDRIQALSQGEDVTREVTTEALSDSQLYFTHDPSDLAQADFHIIAVPTPVDPAKQPDLRAVLGASTLLGPHLKPGDIVVYESTVYPGVTEEECAPVLEKHSGLVCGQDFFLGYSPERINPGDHKHSFTTIQKVVSGQTQEVLDIVAEVYGSVVTAGVYKAASIQVAEAAKVIENTQRDINIALMNELAIMFGKFGIDTADVLAAAGTKWNFLPFTPGLVGGHCIGVDPYYLTYKASTFGMNPEVVLAGRRINDNMGKYIAEQTIKQLLKLDKVVSGARVGILGITFKPDCPDVRNTRVVDIIQELTDYHVNILVHDPASDAHEVAKTYDLSLVGWEDMKDLDVMILAVPHQAYLDMPITSFTQRLRTPKLLIDIKSVLDRAALAAEGVTVWRL